MIDLLNYVGIGMLGFGLGAVGSALAAARERANQKALDDEAAQEARRQQHKDFMDVVDTIEDYKIQVSAASIYLTHGQKAAYAFIVEEFQKTKE